MNMNKERVYLPVELIFIPDYIVSALKSKGISIQDLDNALKGELHRYISSWSSHKYDEKGDRLTTSTCKQLLESKLSRIDLEDLMLFNDPTVLRLQINDAPLQGTSFFDVSFGHSIWYKRENISNTLLTLYNNDMSSKNTKVFDTIPGTDALYVVLHKGFSNYLIDNDYSLQYKVFSSLVDNVLLNFGEGRFLASDICRQYLRMIWYTVKK